MKIAVTGATGFIGKYIVNHFSKRHVVRAIGRDMNVLNQTFGNKIELYESDYSFQSLIKSLENIDVVIHLAAQLMQRDTHPLKLSQFYHGNVQTTENLLLASEIKGISKVCLLSSISVYSKHNTLPFNELALPFPENIYGVSKLACEHLGCLFNDKTKVKVIVLRLARLYGHGEREGLVFTEFIKQASQKQKLTIWGSGNTSIDYIYVKDVISAINKAVTSKSQQGIFNIGSGKSYSIKEIAECINEVFENKGNISFKPNQHEGRFNIYMDCTKAKELLRWSPEWTLKGALYDIKNKMTNQ